MLFVRPYLIPQLSFQHRIKLHIFPTKQPASPLDKLFFFLEDWNLQTIFLRFPIKVFGIDGEKIEINWELTIFWEFKREPIERNRISYPYFIAFLTFFRSFSDGCEKLPDNILRRLNLFHLLALLFQNHKKIYHKLKSIGKVVIFGDNGSISILLFFYFLSIRVDVHHTW